MASDVHAIPSGLADAQWYKFLEDGFLLLGPVASETELAALNVRLDDIMMGRVNYGPRLLMQLDANANNSGSTSAQAGGGSATEYALYQAAGAATVGQTVGFKGPSLAYRKIGEAQAGLEVDDVFHTFQKKDVFRNICAREFVVAAASNVNALR